MLKRGIQKRQLRIVLDVSRVKHALLVKLTLYIYRQDYRFLLTLNNL